MQRAVAVAVVVVWWAAVASAQIIYRNPEGVPYLPKQDTTWTAGNCLIIDSGGNTISQGSCGSGSGDITDVWGCTTGNCNTLTGAAGDSLDAGSADSISPAVRSATLPGTCTEGYTYHDTDSGGTEWYVCTATNTWTKTVAGVDLDTSAELRSLVTDETGSSGALVFAGSPSLTTPTIADFTNATHTHQSNAGGGTLDAAAIAAGTLAVARGGTNLTSAADDNVMVGNATTWQSKALTDCDDTGGNHLNYDTATNVFSCGTSSSGATGAPTGAQYVTLALDGTLSAERTLAAGTMLDLTDGGANSTVTLDWDSTEGNDFTWGDGTDATIQRTYNVSTGTDPVVQYGNGTVNVSTGTLQQGGTAVALQSRSIATGTGLTGGGDLSADRTHALKYTDTLAGNPALGAGECVFGSGAAERGLVCEGATADTIETALLFADPASADKTVTVPAITGTLVTTGDTGTVTGLMIANTTIQPGDMDLSQTYSFTGTLSAASGAFVTDVDTATNCAAIVVDGQQCWASDTNALYIGNGASATLVGGLSGTGTDNRLVRWNGTTAVQDSGWEIDDTGLATITSTSTATSGTVRGVDYLLQFNNTSSSSANEQAITGRATWTGTATTTGNARIQGVVGSGTNTGATGATALQLAAGGTFSAASSSNTATTTTVRGVAGTGFKDGTAAVTTAYGGYFQAGNSNASGTLTNSYGIYIDTSDTTGTITNDYALYTAGTEASYFGGPVGLATTPAAGYELDVYDSAAEALARLRAAGANQDARLELATANESWDVYVDESDSQRLKIASDDANQLFALYTDGRLVANTTSSATGGFARQIYAALTTTPSSAGAFFYGIQGAVSHTGSAKATQLVGMQGSTTAASGSGGASYLYGFIGTATKETTANVDYAYGVYGQVTNNHASGTLGTAYAGYFRVNAAYGTTTNAYGVYIDNPSTGGTITNAYGLYQVGSEANKFTGPVEIINPITGSWTTTSTSDVIAIDRTLTANPASGTAGYVGAQIIATTSSGAAAVTGTTGVQARGKCETSNGCLIVGGVLGQALKVGTGGVTSAYGVYASAGNTNASGTLSNSYGLYVEDSNTTGTITNDWALYTAGAEDSYFGGPVRWAAATTDSAVPAAGQVKRSALAPTNFTFPLPSARTPNERAWREVPGLMSSWATACLVPGKSTTPTSVGIPVTSVGTISHPEGATTNLLTSLNRILVTSSAGAGSSAELYGGHRMVWRGNATGYGGFLFYARFATSTAVATQRAFVGVWDESNAIGNVEPNSKTDTIYIGYNASGTTLNVCGNNNSGNAGCVDLGANFPVSATAVYDVWFYVPPNGSRWDYYVERLDSAQTASGTEADSTDMPRNTQFLQPTAWVNNGSTASAVELNLMRMCVTSPL